MNKNLHDKENGCLLPLLQIHSSSYPKRTLRRKWMDPSQDSTPLLSPLHTPTLPPPATPKRSSLWKEKVSTIVPYNSNMITCACPAFTILEAYGASCELLLSNLYFLHNFGGVTSH